MRTKEELEQILEGKVEGETVMQLGFKKEFEKEFSAKFDYSYLEKGMESFPAVIQLNKSIVMDLSGEPFNSKKIPNARINAAKMTPLPSIPTIDFDNFFPPNPIVKNPISGRSGINQVNCIILFFIEH